MHRRPGTYVAAACAIGVAVIASAVIAHRRATIAHGPTRRAEAAFVGEAVCAACHAREAAAWAESHHRLAMQPATDTTVLGSFSDARFTHGGVASRLFRQGGKYLINTDGPDGALHDYEVRYTFGVAPLQQYLVAFPHGRLQGLEIAWDSRPKTAGGQRWFHLYPDEKIDHDDALHWTGVVENWNYMCADCHSTNVRKAWSPQTASYATSFAEMSVSCEACHGPGSRHVAWANEAPARRSADDGLTIALDERHGVDWVRDPTTHKPARSRARTSQRELDMCARCHSRRGLIHEDSVHGQPVGDDYRVALLDDELYYPDGQIKGEVYEYGSFLQSRMFAEGVTCSDCHDPHRPELRASGDEVCIRCHAADQYVTPKHHFHLQDSAGARCVACHMPAVTYMVVDPRRDHSLRVPRPDLSVELGVPNPCTTCHADRSATWAASTVETWYGHAPSGLQQFAAALSAGTQGAPGAAQLLAAVIADRREPAIARASAIARLPGPPTAPVLLVIRDALGDPDPLVRGAAVHALADADPRLRAALVSPLLDDPVRSVRLEAAMTMAGVPSELQPPRGPLDRAMAELVATHELNGDRPEGHLSLATLHARQQDFEGAETELKRALAIEPAFAPAAVNLADLYRTLGRDAAGESVLRDALVRAPTNPALMQALGLALVRQRRMGEALEWFGSAAHTSDEDPRHGYVYAVALHDAGRRDEALRELDDVLRRHPYDREVLAALVVFHQEAGQLGEALSFAERLAALDPQDRAIASALTELRARLSDVSHPPNRSTPPRAVSERSGGGAPRARP